MDRTFCSGARGLSLWDMAEESRVHRGAHVTSVRLGGEIDALSEPDVLAAISDALATPAAPVLELDLGEVTFMDSYGMYAAIIRTSEMTDKAGISLRVVVNPGLRTTLEHAGLAGLLEIVEPGGT